MVTAKKCIGMAEHVEVVEEYVSPAMWALGARANAPAPAPVPRKNTFSVEVQHLSEAAYREFLVEYNLLLARFKLN